MMCNNIVNIIYWDNHAANTYLYGSNVVFHNEDEVFYDNELMPAGDVIRTWYSNVNYQALRLSAQCPMLIEKREYRLRQNITTIPEETTFIRINFFNRYNEVIDSQIIREKEGTFIVPNEMYSYTIELLNAGCQNFTFNSLEILEVDNHFYHKDGYYISDFYNKNKEKDEIFVIFEEPQLNMANVISTEHLDGLENVLVAGSVKKDARLYLEDSFKEMLLEKIHHYSNISFIGYGDISNIAASYYAGILKTKAYISEEKFSTERYNEKFKKYNLSIKIEDLVEIVDLEQVHYYKVFEKEQSLVSSLTYNENKIKDFVKVYKSKK